MPAEASQLRAFDLFFLFDTALEWSAGLEIIFDVFK